MNWLKRTWQQSGTRWIGYLTAAVGILGTLDANTIGFMAKLVGPKLGDKLSLLCLIVAGVGTAMRGHKNVKDIASATVSQASAGEVQASAKVVTDVAKTAVAAEEKAADQSVPKG